MAAASKLSPSAVHEAGHVVVGYAIGRRVILVRMGSRAVPKDHPHDVLAGSTVSGETRFGPELVSEINRRSKSGQPFDAEHVEWLRAELVTCYAGALAEVQLLGHASEVGKLADLTQGVHVARMLGITDDPDGGEARLSRAGDAADRVITEHLESVRLVAERFSQGSVDFDEPALDALLDKSGVRRGSHRNLLDELA
jgi:hypothetical protein